MLKINQRKENKYYHHTVANVIDINSYHIKSNAYEKIVEHFTDYFLSNSNYMITYEDNDGAIYALLGTNINGSYYEFKLLNGMYDELTNQYIEFQNRLMSSFKNFNIDGVELIIFSSLKKGYGTKMIQLFENELINQNINEYFLLTASDNSYEWYIKNGYKLIDKKTIDLSDLTLINKFDNFETMAFKKSLLK